MLSLTRVLFYAITLAITINTCMLKIFQKKPSSLSDSELVSRYQKSGQLRYLGILYERYTELVYGVCLKILKNETEAEDAFMAIFEKLTKKLQHFDIQQFKPWLHVVVKNHCLEILRKKGKHSSLNYDSEFMQSATILHPFIEDPKNGLLEILDKCLEQLVEEQKSCIELFYYQGKSYKEIAQLKNQEVGKIRSYIQNGRRNLKICIEQKQKSVNH